jgi:hypothetical protein
LEEKKTKNKKERGKSFTKRGQKKGLPKQTTHHTKPVNEVVVRLQCRVLRMVWMSFKFSKEKKRKRRNKTKNPQESTHENRITF